MVGLTITERKHVQDPVNRWADARGILRVTLNLMGNRGWPDNVYWINGGKPLLIEYKAPGEEPRKLQKYVHKRLRELHYEVEVHDNPADAIKSIKAHIEAGKARARSYEEAG